MEPVDSQAAKTRQPGPRGDDAEHEPAVRDRVRRVSRQEMFMLICWIEREVGYYYSVEPLGEARRVTVCGSTKYHSGPAMYLDWTSPCSRIRFRTPFPGSARLHGSPEHKRNRRPLLVFFRQLEQVPRDAREMLAKRNGGSVVHEAPLLPTLSSPPWRFSLVTS
jgi:hypothetical protein